MTSRSEKNEQVVPDTASENEAKLGRKIIMGTYLAEILAYTVGLYELTGGLNTLTRNDPEGIRMVGIAVLAALLGLFDRSMRGYITAHHN